MDTFEALTQLGVPTNQIMNAGRIQGILEIKEEILELSSKKIQGYSHGIAAHIAETLLQKIPNDGPEIALQLKDYMRQRLRNWIAHSLDWSENGLKFNTDVTVKIPQSEFRKFPFTKDEMLEFLNKAWSPADNDPDGFAHAYVKDCADNELDVIFFFNLHKT